ncbi:class I SAM-dependent methyltransferase [Luteibaculum oceani]|uniref:Class I SAM-dependent methyltransferase n=1 Tax=Luteibaculum oceani TaxID=1294296 RepID=A0A5C6V9X6_9FLAO|nr:class I SAM-dependent methyltransferase [Luteibaculum oceani]TXC81534.1 class I SAM-dependent methyltransferase [Luteibaculum oceani]
MSKTIDDVKSFWENNPLFTGESQFEPGSKAFFEHHKEVYYDDVFAGNFEDELYIPKDLENKRVLDLGCGVGFWTIEIAQKRKVGEMHSADLTQNALDVTRKRLDTYEVDSILAQQNAEAMTYESNFFDHINCQGVIHHTPNTEKTVEEIARVLKPGATASISVYYKNFFVRNWSSISWIGKLLHKLGAGLKGRGRESIFNEGNTDEITRLYDGADNPIGKSYSKQEFIDMVAPYFEVEKLHLFFFPARALPIPLPRFLHRLLHRKLGFMIHLSLKKK